MKQLTEQQKDTVRKLFKVVSIIAIVVYLKNQTGCDNREALNLIKEVV